MKIKRPKRKKNPYLCALGFFMAGKKNFFLLPDSVNLLCLYSIVYVAMDEQGGKHYYIT